MVLKACKFLLRLVGAFPPDDGLFSRLRLLVVFINYILICLGVFVELYLHYEDADTVCRGFASMPLIFLVPASLCLAVLKRSDLKTALEMTENFLNSDILNDQLKDKIDFIHAYARKFYAIHRGLCCVVILLNAFAPIFFNINLLVLSYNEHDPFYRRISSLFQFYAVLLFAPMIIGTDGLFVHFIVTAVVEFKIIKFSFSSENLADSKPVALRESIEQHVLLIRFINHLNKIYSSLFLAWVSADFIYLCFGLFLMTKDGIPPPKENVTDYLPSILGVTFQISLYCFLGQILTDTSMTLADVFFYKNWLSREQYENKIEKIMVTRIAQKGQSLSVGGYFTLNLGLLASVIKNVASLVAFIQAVYD